MSDEVKDKPTVGVEIEEIEFPPEYIKSPVEEDQDYPMVLAAATNRCFMGAYFPTDLEEESGRGIIVRTPLLVAEVMDPKTGQAMVFMSKIFEKLSLQDYVQVKYDHLIFLNSRSNLDKNLVLAYGREVERHKAKDAGLIAPTIEDIRNITRS